MREGKEHSLRWNRFGSGAIGSGAIWRLKKNHGYRGKKQWRDYSKHSKKTSECFVCCKKKKKKARP